MSELKPCPFCGSSAQIVSSWSHRSNEYAIQCSGDAFEEDRNYGCPACNYEQDEQGGFGFSYISTVKGDKERAIEIWNTRPIEDQLRAENERLREAIELLQNWVHAYPISVFPEPDLKLARKLLTDGGISYDALNAYSMRHVINGVGKIIDEALNEVAK